MATLSVAAVLAENARRRPDKEALVEGDLRLTSPRSGSGRGRRPAPWSASASGRVTGSP